MILGLFYYYFSTKISNYMPVCVDFSILVDSTLKRKLKTIFTRC